VPLLIF